MNKCKICHTPLQFDDTFKKVYKSVVISCRENEHSFPLPEVCFHCSSQRLLSFSNERNIYRSQDSEGNDIISMYSPDKTYTVYTKDKWYSGDWEGLDYGFELDMKKSFFHQFKELRQKVPVVALNVVNSENCEFNNNIINSKNSYMCFGNDGLEDCSYVTGSFGTKSSLDVWWSTVESCYEIFNCGELYKSYFCSNCSESRDLVLCDSCFNCKDCIMCSNLANQQYCILNQQYSQEEFFKRKEELNLGNYAKLESLKEIFYDFLTTTPKVFSDTIQSEDVSGNYIYYGKNCINCYNTVYVTNSSCFADGGRVDSVANSVVVYNSGGKIISSTMVYDSSYISFSIVINACHNMSYCTDMLSCNYCFGCVGLRHKSYCIFNRQYTQQEYYEELDRCIKKMKDEGVWGDIFPADISLFAYNESLAQDEFPLKKKVVIKKGFHWSDYEAPFPKVLKTIPAEKLPDNIDDTPDDIMNWAIICEKSKKPFRITSQELDFYRKHIIPIPHLHPTERHLQRFEMRAERLLKDDNCDSCKKALQTPYKKERKESIFCRECYNIHVFG